MSDFGATDLQESDKLSDRIFCSGHTIFNYSGVISIFAGYQITQYQKKGIWLMFGAFAIAWISSIVISTIQGNAMDTADTGGFGAVMGVESGICGIFCYAVCGIIVAIPLMLPDGGME